MVFRFSVSYTVGFVEAEKWKHVVFMDNLSAVKHNAGVRTNLIEGAVGFLLGAKNDV